MLPTLALYRHHAIEHFRSNEHRRRLSFLKGDPMIYCMVCNRLPISKELHELSQEHTQHLAGLERAALPTDCTLRQVSECADGRLRASWFPLGFNRLCYPCRLYFYESLIPLIHF